MTFVGVIPGTLVFASAVQGYLNNPLSILQRLTLSIAMVLFFWPSWIATLCGVIPVALVWKLSRSDFSQDSSLQH